MLWLCITLPQLPLEALQCEPSERPTVVTVLEGSVRSVVCCNPAAERVGLKPAMNFTTALAILPEVIAMERRLSAEQAALERLATWAYQFSGTVILGEILRRPAARADHGAMAGDRREPAFVRRLPQAHRTAGNRAGQAVL